MTSKQFRRMKVFALRMVRVSTSGRWQKLVREHVEEVLGRIECENFGCHYSAIENWDRSDKGSKLLSDLISDYLWDEGLERERGQQLEVSRIGNAASCCIRAACDIAVAPSGGVIGFTVGDLRKMWGRRRLPAWVTLGFEPAVETAADSASIWL